MKQQPRKTSWQPVGKWYNKLVGDRGQYYHEHVVMPNTLRLLGLKLGDSVLDIACGQGVLGRAIPDGIFYTGVDIAPSLIEFAKKSDKKVNHTFIAADVTKPLPIAKKDFTHAAMILSIQNIEQPEKAIANIDEHLVPEGKLVIVMNHPCFRIPRQSAWGIDPESKQQYRRINRYLSPLSIPVSIHPGTEHSPVTWSFHRPLSAYVQMLVGEGFTITALEEWTSDKESVGKAAKMENRARSEFPLFLALTATKE